MKPEMIYQELKDLAEKLGITVKEENFKKTGIHVKSGLCKIKGEQFFIMDKHKKILHAMKPYYTVKAIIEAWPECEDAVMAVYLKSVQEPKIHLPAPLFDNLNKELGLS